MEITILEGARGTYKSTLASKLRQKNADTTLINFTGFNKDGLEGLEKVRSYYRNFMLLLNKLHDHDSKFVFDRFFFSEMVYSKLYKHYDFETDYKWLAEYLEEIADKGVKVNIIFLTVNDREELAKRLNRDKVPFWNAVESVEETLKQQKGYHDVFSDLFHDRLSLSDKVNKNLKIHMIDTSHKTSDEVYEHIVKATS